MVKKDVVLFLKSEDSWKFMKLSLLNLQHSLELGHLTNKMKASGMLD